MFRFSPAEQFPVEPGHTAQIMVPAEVGTAYTTTLFGSELNQLFSVVTIVSAPGAAVTSTGPAILRIASVLPGSSFPCHDHESPWFRPGASKSPPKLAPKPCASAGMMLPVRALRLFTPLCQADTRAKPSPTTTTKMTEPRRSSARHRIQKLFIVINASSCEKPPRDS